MKLKLGGGNINDIVLETDDGQDVLALLAKNGLFVENMRLIGLEPMQMPKLTLNCYVHDMEVELPADHCDIVVRDKRPNSRDINDHSR